MRNWKSSTAYFLNRGMVVAGGVMRPPGRGALPCDDASDDACDDACEALWGLSAPSSRRAGFWAGVGEPGSRGSGAATPRPSSKPASDAGKGALRGSHSQC